MPRTARVAPIFFILILSAALALSCASEQSSESELIVKNTLEDLPNCSNGKFAAVYYVVSTDEFYFCNGYEFVPVDLSGQDGEDGQDGTSCTVTRDEAAGTTTLSCEDGTQAIVYDGEDGQDGTSCTIAATAAGAAITCGSDTVTITDGQDGSSCSASTDASGAVTISCDDGTSATIPAGGDGGVTVELLCQLIGLNNLSEPPGLDCAPFCPCFSEEDILASDATGCITTDFRLDAASGELTSTLPLAPNSEGDEVGRFEAGDFPDTAGLQSYCVQQPPDYFFANGLGRAFYLECVQIIEETVGPCEQQIRCDSSRDCSDGESCTDNSCNVDTGLCESVRKPDGFACLLPDSTETGECFLGVCRPVLGGL